MFGRDDEVARVHASLHAAGTALVVAELGAGRTALLDVVAEELQASGWHALRITGTPDESDLAFAGLHQLLAPSVMRSERLGEEHTRVLSSAFGLTAQPPHDVSHPVGMAVLAALTELSAVEPLLLVIDDAHWVDAHSLRALTFAVRRLPAGSVALLLSSLEGAPRLALEGELPRVSLCPLPPSAAHLLLDGLARPPHGRFRLRVLEQAAGNPLALTDLAITGGSDPHLLPVSTHLERRLEAQLGELPARTRRALLLAAVEPSSGVALVNARVWAPAERANVIDVTADRVRFRHPLMRTAIYHSVGADSRRRAHLAAAATLLDQPDRRAWHMSMASALRGEELGSTLAATAEDAQRRLGDAAAAEALERAAELTLDPTQRVDRLLKAADHTLAIRQPQWTHELISKANLAALDASAAARTALRSGRALGLNHHYAAALSVMSQVAPRAPHVEQQVGLQILEAGAVISYHSGEQTHREEVRHLLSAYPTTDGLEPQSALIMALTAPLADRGVLMQNLPRLVANSGRRPEKLSRIAAVAWLLDESSLAVTLFDDALDQSRARGGIPFRLACAAWMTYFEAGRWDTAQELPS